MRDAYAFRQHVATARRNRGLEMIPEFDLFPVTYFTNHLAVTVPGEVLVQDVKDKLEQIPTISATDVELVFDPTWSREMMSEAARLQTGMM